MYSMHSLLGKPLKLSNERLLSPKDYIRLFEKNRSAIAEVQFIPPRLGGNEIAGRVRVKLKPGYRYATK